MDAFRLSLNLGKVLVDRATAGILGPTAFSVDFGDRQRLRDLLAEGRGLVLVTAHVGCWQTAMSVLGSLNAPIAMLMHRDAGDVDRQYFEHQGEGRNPFRIIDPSGFLGGTVEMLDVLRGGGVVCIMGDRPFGSDASNAAVAFLGGTIRVPVSPYKIAGAAGCPVAVVFSHKTGPARYALEIAEVLRVEHTGGRGAAGLTPLAARFVRALEEFTRLHPYQFFNFHDMWAG